MIKKNTRALILAAGKGTRMKSDLPKVLHTIMDKPIINYVVKALSIARVERVGVVVSPENHVSIHNTLGNSVDYIVQDRQLGTGHAVLAADEWLKDFNGSLIVVVGDAPFITSDIIERLIEAQQKDSVASLLTVTMDPPPPWGRIVRDSDGRVLRIVEEKDANARERQITEVSSSHYCFDWDCLYRALHFVKADNAQQEYYLPDVIEIMIENGESVTTVHTDDILLPFGINSPEDLQFAETEMKKRKTTND